MPEALSGVPQGQEAFPDPSSAQRPRRYLALWLPFLSTDRARRQGRGRISPERDERAFVLVEKQRGTLRLVAVDALAVRTALQIGMSLTAARALVPDMRVEEANRQADAQWLLAVAASCERFTPLVACDGVDGLLLDITGCAHLFGDEEGLRNRARNHLLAHGLKTCTAIAGTPDAARVFARFARESIVRPGEEEVLARRLPVSAMDQDTDTAIALTRAGFRTIGDLADRPPALLTARFGPDLAIALQRILGREDIRITPLRALPESMAEQHFPEPLSLMESLLGVLERLACDIAGSLEQRDAGGRVFEASFFRVDGIVRRLVIETAQATRDAQSLMRLIRLRIETLADPLDPGFGFDVVRLAVMRSEPLHERQRVLASENEFAGCIRLAGEDETENGEPAIAELIARLVARFGRENVQRLIANDTHDPARATGTTSYLSGKVSAPWRGTEPDGPPVRPLTLFEPPQLIEALAEVPDGPPLRFRWRRMVHEVARAEGPERIAPEWWREGNHAPATRDYYRVENARGHRFWLFREGLYEDSKMRPRWFLHGLFA